MSQKWRDAIERSRRTNLSTAKRVIEDLEAFISGTDGEDAKKLLAITKRQLSFGKMDVGNGLESTWLMTFEGFVRTTQKKGCTDPTPTVMRLGISMFVNEVADRTTQFKDPTCIIPWIRTEIDQIAESILCPTSLS